MHLHKTWPFANLFILHTFFSHSLSVLTTHLPYLIITSFKDILALSMESPEKVATAKEVVAIKKELDGMTKIVPDNRDDLAVN